MKRLGHALAVCSILLGSMILVESQLISADLLGNIPYRLVFRPQGLVEAWKDPKARRSVLRGTITLDQSDWQQAFADTGGVAVVARGNQGLENFTITGVSNLCSSQSCTSAADSSQFSADNVPPELDFNFISNAMLVGEHGTLQFDNVIISNIAGIDAYQYSLAQPYRSVGIGSGTWPTIAMAPNSKLVLINITLIYRNPSPDDTCEQFNQRAVYSLQQVYGTNNVTIFTKTAARFPSALMVPVKVFNGSNNSPLGEAQILVQNVTFSCVPPPSPAQSGSLSTGALAAAIAAPVAAALMLGLLACWWFRRIRCRRGASGAGAAVKDVEAGRLSGEMGPNARRMNRDQGAEDDARDKVLPLGILTGGSAQTSSQRSSGQYQTASYTTGSYPGSSASAATSSASTAPATPGMGVSSPAAAVANLRLPATRDSGDGRTPELSLSSLAAMQMAGGASYNRAKTAAAAAASRQRDAEQHPAADPASHGQLIAENPSAGQHQAAMQHNSGAPHPGPGISGGDDTNSVGASGSRASGGGSGGNTSGQVGAPAAESSGSPGIAGGSNSLSGRTMALYDRASNVSGLLKSRSDMAVLRDLKIGPLLGRGSYGRVYKGRWKAVTVAVKIIEHHEGSPGTASSGGKRINVGRESLLATTMAHPNVVQTYHISTMTVSQRNALANSWLEEQVREAGSTGSGKVKRNDCSKAGTTVGETEEYNDSSSDDEQKDPVETWMLMEFCEKGSLERAIGRGKFIRKDNGNPEMIGIYKALLDTASGLDYLHSIGVVHGDLKTANVLLKGSTRDVRGFACKITDFGLSRVLDLDATHISTRTYGTIVYMPAELLLTGRMSYATDVYSFGLMMWELYTSTRVFDEGLSIGQIFYMIAYQGWRPHMPPGCPPGFAALMAACWHQVPEQRPTVQQLLRSLQSLYMAEKKAMAAAKDLATKGLAKISAPHTASGGTPPNRHSSESDRSDRYRSAAAVSSRDGAQRMAGQPITSELAVLRSVAAAVPPSAAAAGATDAQQWQQIHPEQPASPAASEEPSAGGVGVPVASSLCEGQGSGGSLATIYYRQSNDGAGADKAGHGSGDTVVTLDENVYQPWAEAVTHDDEGTRTSPGQQRNHSQDPVTAGQQHQHIQQQQGQAASTGPQQPQQQQASAEHHDLRLLDGTIQPAIDVDATPSGSLFQPNNTSGSSAIEDVQDLENVQDLDKIDKDVIAAAVDAGAMNYSRRSVDQQLQLQQQGKASLDQLQNVADAAQGFVEAIEMVSRPAAAPANSPAVAVPPMAPYPAAVPSSSGSTSSRQLPYHYQQRPMLLQMGANPGGLHAGLAGNLPVLPSGLASGWSSVSTGAMPPVMGDSPTASYATSLPGSGSFTSPSSAIGAGSGSRWDGSSSGRLRDLSVSAGATASGASPQAGIMGVMLGSSSSSAGSRLQLRQQPVSQPPGWYADQVGDDQAVEAAFRAAAPAATSPTRRAGAPPLGRPGGSSRAAQGLPSARAAAAPMRLGVAAAGGSQHSGVGGKKGLDDDDASRLPVPSPFAALADPGESCSAPHDG